jgi:hypothetical protein
MSDQQWGTPQPQPPHPGQFQPSPNNNQPGQYQQYPFSQPLPPTYYNPSPLNQQGGPPAEGKYIPTEQQGYPRPPQKVQSSGFSRFMKRRVSVPLWVIILAVLVFIGSIEYSTSVVGTNTTNGLSDNANTPTVVSDTPTTVPVLAPTPILTPTAIPTPTTAPKPTPTPKPTQPPKWTTVNTFTGNGSKKTTVFNAPDSWKLVWSCNPSSSFGGEYNVIVAVKGSDGSDIDSGAVNTICKAGNTGDSTQEYQGGSAYLDVISEGAWTIKIQVFE